MSRTVKDMPEECRAQRRAALAARENARRVRLGRMRTVASLAARRRGRRTLGKRPAPYDPLAVVGAKLLSDRPRGARS